MKPIPGSRPAEVQELARAQDRLSFIYLERCQIHRESNAITSTSDKGVVHIPAAIIGALLLGPGTNITHQAMMLLADSGATAVWVGEHGVRYYAHGRPLARRTRLLELQASACVNRDERLKVARRMYELRFPDESVATATLKQLRGREGTRVRQAYRDAAEDYGVTWDKRSYKPTEFEASDPVNQALTAATSCLYGVTHAVIVALGLVPGLGFVHTGQDRSFVYDIADLYKTEIAVPIAFEMAAQAGEDLPGETRRAMRDEIHARRLLTRCVRDIHTVLAASGDPDEGYGWDILELWDESGDSVLAGRSWGDEPDW